MLRHSSVEQFWGIIEGYSGSENMGRGADIDTAGLAL